MRKIVFPLSEEIDIQLDEKSNDTTDDSNNLSNRLYVYNKKTRVRYLLSEVSSRFLIDNPVFIQVIYTIHLMKHLIVAVINEEEGVEDGKV